MEKTSRANGVSYLFDMSSKRPGHHLTCFESTLRAERSRKYKSCRCRFRGLLYCGAQLLYVWRRSESRKNMEAVEPTQTRATLLYFRHSSIIKVSISIPKRVCLIIYNNNYYNYSRQWPWDTDNEDRSHINRRRRRRSSLEAEKTDKLWHTVSSRRPERICPTQTWLWLLFRICTLKPRPQRCFILIGAHRCEFRYTHWALHYELPQLLKQPQSSTNARRCRKHLPSKLILRELCQR